MQNKSEKLSQEEIVKAALANPHEARIALDRADAAESLIAFIKLAWHTIEPGTPFTTGWAVDCMARHLEAVTRGDIKRLLVNVPPGCTKALDISEQVLTTRGWKNHGDLRPGDFVYGPDGQPKRVIAVTPHAMQPSSIVEFVDGAKVHAADTHLWKIERDVPTSTRGRATEIVQTQDLVHGSRPDRIPLPKPLEHEPKSLDIDPYVLGSWIGDGSQWEGIIYVSEPDLHNLSQYGEVRRVEKAGSRTYTKDFFSVRPDGLTEKLRLASLIGDKRIPEEYLQGSVEQRWELLRGLMDTDGHCEVNGRCGFTQTNRAIAYQVHELIASLGMKPNICKRRSRQGTQEYNPSYRIMFRPNPGDVVFKLQRKQERIKQAVSPKSTNRYIKSVTKTEPTMVNCIQVEGEIYLVGHDFVPTHNSVLVNTFWPAWEWGPKGLPFNRFISASYERGLATRDMIRCRDIISSKWYQERWPIKFKDDQSEKTFYQNESTGWRFASSVGGRLTGYRGDRIIIDDPSDTKGAESDLVRATATRWFTETLPTRLNKADESAMVMIMQRLHVQDLSGVVIGSDLAKEWVHLVLPMEAELKNRSWTCVPNGTTPRRMRRIKEDADPVPYYEPDPVNGELLYLQDPRTEEGELLWPERFSRKAVEDLKKAFRSGDGGSYAESGQLQQRPVHREGGLFKRDDLHMTSELPPNMRWVRGWDLAASKNKKADWTVGVKLGMKDGNIYIWDVQRFKGTPHEVEVRMRSTAELDGHDCAISVPQDPGQAGKSQKSRLAQVLSGFNVHFSTESGDKEVRATPIAAQCGAGNVYVRENAHWLPAFLAEFGLFPAAVHDDQIDALARAYSYFLLDHEDGAAISAPSIIFDE